jgi:hypothetical protein
MSTFPTKDLIFLHDSQNNFKFLVNSGASISILPHSSSAPPTGPHLVGANGKLIPTWGHRRQTVCFAGHNFEFYFFLAAVATPIIGMDFLAKFELSIIPATQQVLHAASGRTFTKAITNSFVSPWNSKTAAAVATLPPRVQKLLEEFLSLLRPSAAPLKPLHGVVYHIDTGSAAPVFARPRQVDPEKHRITEEEFLALEKAGTIRRSNSPWSSLLHLVPKKDGSWHPCGDYRCLNAVTIPDRYPLPNMQSLIED